MNAGVVTWDEFAERAPELAERGRARFEATGLSLVGSIRSDGTPRISPVEPLVLDGRLYLGMMWQSLKARDLIRDPRVLVHSCISNKDGSDGEFKLRGKVADVTDPAERIRYADAVEEQTQWRPPEPYHLFVVGIENAAYVFFKDEVMHMKRWPGPDAWETRAG
jgi:hypothetical protein